MTGLRQNPETLKLELSDQDVKNLKEWLNKDKRSRPDKFESQTGQQEVIDGVTFTPTHHHVIGWECIVDILKNDFEGSDDNEIKDKMEKYLNASRNEKLRQFILKEMHETRTKIDEHYQITKNDKFDPDLQILQKSVVWNPNIIVTGPDGKKRKNDPDHGGDKYKSGYEKHIEDLLKDEPEKQKEFLKYREEIDQLFVEKTRKLTKDNEAWIDRIRQVLINANENNSKIIDKDIQTRIAKPEKHEVYKNLNQQLQNLRQNPISNEDKLKEMRDIIEKSKATINVTATQDRFKDIVFKIDRELVLRDLQPLIDRLGGKEKINILEGMSNADIRNRGELKWTKIKEGCSQKYIFQQQ
ncbi:unnamed protein product [Didymodactylos carnosus]|nr:unnamed protein product [Didymodactylos carnosus]CAF4287216.1 unnamed protein product [Didymodactylos carnosus]